MANEIKVLASLECTNGNFKLPRLGVSQLNVTQNTRGGGVPGLMLATTGGVDVVTTGVATLGWCYITNTDPVNYIEWGPYSGAFYPIGRLKAGESAVFRLGAYVLHLKANTATCKVQVVILED